MVCCLSLLAPGLAATLTQDSLVNLATTLSEEETKELVQHLPEGQQTSDHLMANLTSPQLLQAMNSLTEAIEQSGENLEMMFLMCGLDTADLHSGDGMEALIKAFVKKYSH